MRSRTRWILISLTLSLLSVAVLVPLSKAQVGKISKGALLLQKSVLSLPPRVFGAAMLGSSLKPAARDPDQSDGVIAGSSYHNDTSPPLREMKQLPIESRGEREANEHPRLQAHHEDRPDEVVQSEHVSSAGIAGATPLELRHRQDGRHAEWVQLRQDGQRRPGALGRVRR